MSDSTDSGVRRSGSARSRWSSCIASSAICGAGMIEASGEPACEAGRPDCPATPA
ncbi:MAG: hypothetical protein EHM23_33445 [Acidobacteria bacterium]|nr:MAG: hypothetical protein EHM23_33445 [Acidobacteriota bacterium]